MIKFEEFYNNGNYIVAVAYEDDKRVALRLSNEEDIELIPKYPELVDIKLTNVCHIGCAWCYQDSVSDSVHGDLYLIKKVIESLHPMTEVAFGGGDVLMHPNIVEILEFSRSKGLKSSNITMNWQSIMRYPDEVKMVMPLIDAIGVSITGVGQIEKVVNQLKALNCYQEERICFHVIPDLYSKEAIIKMIVEANTISPNSDILFLGYKDNGRGAIYKPKHSHNNEMDFIFGYIKELNVPLQVDTKFVKDYIGVVEKYGHKLTYDIREGEFSMNIDCVEKFYSIASYNLSFKGAIDDAFDIVEAFGRVREQTGLKAWGKK